MCARADICAPAPGQDIGEPRLDPAAGVTREDSGDRVRVDAPQSHADGIELGARGHEMSLGPLAGCYADVEMAGDRVRSAALTLAVPSAALASVQGPLGADEAEAQRRRRWAVRLRESRVVQQRADEQDLLVVRQPALGREDDRPDVGPIRMADQEVRPKSHADRLGLLAGSRVGDPQPVDVERGGAVARQPQPLAERPTAVLERRPDAFCEQAQGVFAPQPAVGLARPTQAPQSSHTSTVA